MGTPARRIALAVALSLSLHIAFLWLPKVQLPHDEALPPPLAAKLEPLPKLAVNPAPKRSAKPKPARPPEPEAKPVSDHEVANIPEPSAASGVAAASAVAAIPEPLPEPAVAAASAVAVVEEPAPAHPLPKRAQLTFAVQMGADGFKIGEVKHQLEINGDEYLLKAETRTTGLAGLFKTYHLTQTSRGKAGNHGLQPEIFEEEKITGDGKQALSASFDWPAHMLQFSLGGETALPAGAQDILSIFYQLSQLPIMDREIISLAVSNGKKLEKYELGVGTEEEISTPMGKLHALHLRKLHADGESGSEIWLGLEYRLLPVKYLLIEPSGKVAGAIVISDIRVADE